MLVVVKHRNFHALAQFALNVKTVRSLDVFKVDCAKGWLQRRNDFNQLDRVFFIDFDVKHIDACELFEQNSLALHDWLCGQRTNIAQAQHRSSVGDDRHQVTACGVLVGSIRVLDNFFARRCYARRISQRQVALVCQLFGGRDLQFSGSGEFVVFQRSSAQFCAFFFVFLGACFLKGVRRGSNQGGHQGLQAWGRGAGGVAWRLAKATTSRKRHDCRPHTHGVCHRECPQTGYL